MGGGNTVPKAPTGNQPVATIGGRTVTFGQTMQGNGMQMTPGGQIQNITGLGKPIANINGSNIYQSQGYKSKADSPMPVPGGGGHTPYNPSWSPINSSFSPMGQDTPAPTILAGKGVIQNELDDPMLKKFLAWQKENGY